MQGNVLNSSKNRAYFVIQPNSNKLLEDDDFFNNFIRMGAKASEGDFVDVLTAAAQPQVIVNNYLGLPRECSKCSHGKELDCSMKEHESKLLGAIKKTITKELQAFKPIGDVEVDLPKEEVMRALSMAFINEDRAAFNEALEKILRG